MVYGERVIRMLCLEKNKSLQIGFLKRKLTSSIPKFIFFHPNLKHILYIYISCTDLLPVISPSQLPQQNKLQVIKYKDECTRNFQEDNRTTTVSCSLLARGLKLEQRVPNLPPSQQHFLINNSLQKSINYQVPILFNKTKSQGFNIIYVNIICSVQQFRMIKLLK